MARARSRLSVSTRILLHFMHTWNVVPRARAWRAAPPGSAVQGKLSPDGPVQFHQVVGGAHDTPLRTGLLDASQQEAAPATRFLDLTEDRLRVTRAASRSAHGVILRTGRNATVV